MKRLIFGLATMISTAMTTITLAEENAGISGPVKLEGACTELGFHDKFINFVLIQDPLGGVESKYGFAPDAGGRLTVEIENLGQGLDQAAQFYTVKFKLHSFHGDNPVFEDEERFEFLGDEQRLSAILVSRKGTKVECLAEFRKVKN